MRPGTDCRCGADCAPCIWPDIPGCFRPPRGISAPIGRCLRRVQIKYHTRNPTVYRQTHAHTHNNDRLKRRFMGKHSRQCVSEWMSVCVWVGVGEHVGAFGGCVMVCLSHATCNFTDNCCSVRELSGCDAAGCYTFNDIYFTNNYNWHKWQRLRFLTNYCIHFRGIRPAALIVEGCQLQWNQNNNGWSC